MIFTTRFKDAVTTQKLEINQKTAVQMSVNCRSLFHRVFLNKSGFVKQFAFCKPLETQTRNV